MTSQEQTNNARYSREGGRIVAGIDGSPVSLMALEGPLARPSTRIFAEVVAAGSAHQFRLVVHSRWLRSARDMAETLEPVLEKLRPLIPTWWELESRRRSSGAVLIHESVGGRSVGCGQSWAWRIRGDVDGSTSEHCVANAACPVVVIRFHS